MTFFFFWVYDVNFFDRYNPDIGGNAAEWVGGVLTGGAVIIGVATLTGELEHRRTEVKKERVAAANMVAVSVGVSERAKVETHEVETSHFIRVSIRISNHSPYPIRDLTLVLGWPYKTSSSYRNQPDNAAVTEHRPIVGPEQHWTLETERYGPPNIGLPKVLVQWTDVWTTRWSCEDGCAPAAVQSVVE